MRPEQLTEHYPRLYHMAWSGSWAGIETHGLLSTRSLVELYGPSPSKCREILRRHRPEWVPISGAGLPGAAIRDQKPMDDQGVCRALGTADPRPWYELLNSMVFFWPTIRRLRTMMNARAYRGMGHDLLVVNTARLVEGHRDRIRLSHMNSGATKPYPHRRDFGLFKTFGGFPFDERRKSHGPARAIAEVCVVDGIPDIADVVDDIHQATAVEKLDSIGL